MPWVRVLGNFAWQSFRARECRPWGIRSPKGNAGPKARFTPPIPVRTTRNARGNAAQILRNFPPETQFFLKSHTEGTHFSSIQKQSFELPFRSQAGFLFSVFFQFHGPIQASSQAYPVPVVHFFIHFMSRYRRNSPYISQKNVPAYSRFVHGQRSAVFRTESRQPPSFPTENPRAAGYFSIFIRGS